MSRIREIDGARDRQAVAASQTDAALQSTRYAGGGGVQDYLSHIVIQPATTGPGTVIIKDGATTVYTFPGGTVSDIKPFTVPIAAKAHTGWTITTGLNVSVTAVGHFDRLSDAKYTTGVAA